MASSVLYSVTADLSKDGTDESRELAMYVSVDDSDSTYILAAVGMKSRDPWPISLHSVHLHSMSLVLRTAVRYCVWEIPV